MEKVQLFKIPRRDAVRPRGRLLSRVRSNRAYDGHCALMRRTTAAVGSAIWFLVAPTTIAGVAPWWLTRWEVSDRWLAVGPLRALGAAMTLVAVVVIIRAFVRFVVEGAGTPVPVAPTERLVVGGIYRYVRNPMYVALVAAIVGQAFVLGEPMLVAYAGVVLLVFMAFVRFHEEPVLRRRFGADYEAYMRAVPGWWPRLRPWEPDGPS